jgi:hypothetical protein
MRLHENSLRDIGERYWGGGGGISEGFFGVKNKNGRE